MTDKYILEGKEPKPVDDLLHWARWYENNADARRVLKTEVHFSSISTVFLAMDHRFGDGPPLLFETMIFGGEHDGDQWRYSTWDEAEAGHKRAVELVKKSIQ